MAACFAYDGGQGNENLGESMNSSKCKLAGVLSGIGALFLVAGCAPTSDQAQTPPATAVAEQAASVVSKRLSNERNAYFGELHVHTQYSFDAFIFGTRSTPDSAYEYAKGKPLAHPSGFDMQLRVPLDFQSVTDHAMYMGMLPAMDQADSKVGQHSVAVAIREAGSPAERIAAFQNIFPYIRKQLDGPDDLLDMEIVRSAWEATVDAAERHNEPGKFTTFIGYEYTAAGTGRENLHRNVIFRGAGPTSLPFSSMDSLNPEDLWDWQDEQRAQGVESLAIPHNSNGSDGMMFALAQTDGSPMTADYAAQRMRNEPLVEISQVKGTSETHPMLSPNDEWADFELMQVKVATVESSKPEGSYVREAYLNGLQMQQDESFNPYRFGIVSATDSHVGAGAFDEDNYWSKVGIVDGTPQGRGSVPLAKPNADGSRYPSGSLANFDKWGASGLAGVWAEQNTRASIYDAFRRKETFGTSGPRIKVRFFAGYDYDADLLDAQNVTQQLYAGGVPMGGRLQAAAGAAPTFYLAAIRDVHSAPLQRLQVVKGWLEDGTTKEQVFDVACSDGGTPNAEHRCPDNNAKVDLQSCQFDQDVGAGELTSLWQDPEFSADQAAFYYVRVLENPSCRWSTWDAIRAGVAPRESLHSIIQERAWSSPIWFSPVG